MIAATNFVKSLDSALVRPGRFDKVVDVNMPDVAGRKAILELYSKNIELNRDVDLGQLAKGTPGFTGADLQNLINQAAVKASVEGLKSIGMQALEYAKDKILMGAERRSAVLSPETIKMTAFHEAGHALVALKTDGADPIHKATVMPRGSSLGMVMQLQDSDQTSQSRKQMLAMLDICMGGRVAEEIVYGAENVTSGKQNSNSYFLLVFFVSLFPMLFPVLFFVSLYIFTITFTCLFLCRIICFHVIKIIDTVHISIINPIAHIHIYYPFPRCIQ